MGEFPAVKVSFNSCLWVTSRSLATIPSSPVPSTGMSGLSGGFGGRQPSLNSRLLPPQFLGRAWRWLKAGASIPGPCGLADTSGYQPALGLQSTADGGQGEEGWGAVRGDKLLPEELHVEAEVQCSGQAIRICIHLPDDLQVGRQWSGMGCWCAAAWQGWAMLVCGQDRKDGQKREVKTVLGGLHLPRFSKSC